MLARVFSAQYGQSLADGCSHHKRVGCAKAILVWLGQSKVLKVQAQLAHVGRLLDGHLAGVRSVVAARIARVHEGSLVLVGLAAASELSE